MILDWVNETSSRRLLLRGKPVKQLLVYFDNNSFAVLLQLEPVANRLFSLGDRTPGDHQPLVEEVDAEGNPVTDADGAPVMVRPPLLSSRARPPSTIATSGLLFPTDRVKMMTTGA